MTFNISPGFYVKESDIISNIEKFVTITDEYPDNISWGEVKLWEELKKLNTEYSYLLNNICSSSNIYWHLGWVQQRILEINDILMPSKIPDKYQDDTTMENKRKTRYF